MTILVHGDEGGRAEVFFWLDPAPPPGTKDTIVFLVRVAADRAHPAASRILVEVPILADVPRVGKLSFPVRAGCSYVVKRAWEDPEDTCPQAVVSWDRFSIEEGAE